MRPKYLITSVAAAVAATLMLTEPALAADPAPPPSPSPPTAGQPGPAVIPPCPFVTDAGHVLPYCSDSSKEVTFSLPGGTSGGAESWTFSYPGGGTVVRFSSHFAGVEPPELAGVGLNIWDETNSSDPVEVATPLTNGRPDDPFGLLVNYSSAKPGDVTVQLFNQTVKAVDVTFSQSGLGPASPPLMLKLVASSGPGAAPEKLVPMSQANGKLAKGQGVQGAMAGTVGGGQEADVPLPGLTFTGDGNLATITFSYTPLYKAANWGIGFAVYGPDGFYDYVDATRSGSGVDYVPTVAGATYTIRAFNYIPAASVQYTISLR